jgi:hypothetical protein
MDFLSLQANDGIVPQIRAKLIPSTFLPIYGSLIHLIDIKSMLLIISHDTQTFVIYLVEYLSEKHL